MSEQSGAPRGAVHGHDEWTTGERQLAGPGRVRFEIGHSLCCRRWGHAPGWCDREPDRYREIQRQPSLRPELPIIELALTDVALQEAAAQLDSLEALAVRAWAQICLQVGYPPLVNDEAAKEDWRDRANPLWRQVGYRHGIGPDVEQNLSASARLKNALWTACERIAMLTGWTPKEDEPSKLIDNLPGSLLE